MSKGAELAGTGICSGEGGMLPEEQADTFVVWIGDAQDRIELDQRLDSLRLLLVSLAQ